MEVQVSRLTDNQNEVAFTYGPIVLSAGLGTDQLVTAPHSAVIMATKPAGVVTQDTITINSGTGIETWLANIKSNLVQTAGKLEFTLKNTDSDGKLTFTPQYQRYKDRYGIYFKLAGTAGGNVPDAGVCPASGGTGGSTSGGASGAGASTAAGGVSGAGGVVTAGGGGGRASGAGGGGSSGAGGDSNAKGGALGGNQAGGTSGTTASGGARTGSGGSGAGGATPPGGTSSGCSCELGSRSPGGNTMVLALALSSLWAWRRRRLHRTR
jgi:hypothetical protein